MKDSNVFKFVNENWKLLGFFLSVAVGYVTLGRTVQWHTRAIRKQGKEINVMQRHEALSVLTLDAVAQAVLNDRELKKLDVRRKSLEKVLSDESEDKNEE